MSSRDKFVEVPISMDKSDKIKLIQKETDETKGIMMDTINQALKRGDKLNLLEDDANKLEESGAAFKKVSSDLKKNMCWRQWKLILLITCIILFILLVIILSLIPWKKN
jgi:flagellar biosynthesis/type III secretory pathway M-ring protein FliF/YscJ